MKCRQGYIDLIYVCHVCARSMCSHGCGPYFCHSQYYLSVCAVRHFMSNGCMYRFFFRVILLFSLVYLFLLSGVPHSGQRGGVRGRPFGLRRDEGGEGRYQLGDRDPDGLRGQGHDRPVGGKGKFMPPWLHSPTTFCEPQNNPRCFLFKSRSWAQGALDKKHIVLHAFHFVRSPSTTSSPIPLPTPPSSPARSTPPAPMFQLVHPYLVHAHLFSNSHVL